MTNDKSDSVRSSGLDTLVKRNDRHLADSSRHKIFSSEVATLVLLGDFHLHVFILIDGEFELSRVLNLCGSEEGVDNDATVGCVTNTIIVITSFEVESSLVSVPLLDVVSINRNSVSVSIRLEESLSNDRVVLELQVFGVSQFDEASLEHRDRYFHEDSPSRACANL